MPHITAPPSLDDSTTATPYRLPVAVWVLCAGALISRAGSFVLVFMTLYISEQLGFGISFATKCFGAYGLGSILASMLGGHLADHWGRRPVMIGSLLGGAATMMLLSVATQRWSVLLLVFTLALVLDMFRPAATAMVSDLVVPPHRPRAYALLYVTYNLGFSVAAPIGGFLAYYSFQWLFWGDALTTAIFGLVVAFGLAETLPAGRQSDSTQVGSQPKIGWQESMWYMARDTTFMMFSAATLITSVVFMQAFTTLPIHLKQLGFRESEIGLLLGTNGMLIVLCQWPVTHWLTRYDRVLMILLGECLMAIGFGLTTFAHAAWTIALTIVIWTMGEVVQASFKQSLVADLAPTTMRARYMGVFSLCHAAGITIGAPVGGAVLERCGHAVLWSGCFALLMCSTSIYGCMLKWHDRPLSRNHA